MTSSYSPVPDISSRSTCSPTPSPDSGSSAPLTSGTIATGRAELCQALVLLATLDAACAGADDLELAAAEEFRKHPDHAIITSFPGLADLAGARVLAEIGDDRNRFATARSLKANAGSAPVTRASGRSISITYRRIKNDRLAATGWIWAFAAAINQGPAREHYLARRTHGDRHTAALRHLFNKMLGQLHHCLRTDQTFDPAKAFLGPKVPEPLAA